MAKKDDQAKGDRTDIDQDDDESLAPDFMDARHVLGGVSMTWLSTVFRMDKNVVRKRVAQCRVLRYERANAPLFELKEVLPHFVPPATADLTEHIKKMNKSDLPVYMQDEFWAAQLKRQKWEENAGELWRTEDVVDVFSDTFKTIADTLQMWPDTVEVTNGLTDDQRKTLDHAIESLKSEVYRRMVNNAKSKQHENLRLKEEKEQDTKTVGKDSAPSKRALDHDV